MSSWMVNPATGDYVMEKGAPVPTESLKVPAYYRLASKRGTWLYAPNDQWGSDFHLQRKRFNGGDLSPLQNMGERALQPLIDDGRAADIAVGFDPNAQASRNNAALKVSILDAQGEIESFNFPRIGE